MEWSPLKPTRSKTSPGGLPKWRRMKYSGMSRPEVDPLEPKVKVLPAIPAGKPASLSAPLQGQVAASRRPVLVWAMK